MNKLLLFFFESYLRLKQRIKRHPHLRQVYQTAKEKLTNQAYFNNLHVHERMLADHVRVDAYQQAITSHVKEGDVALDLGTGTGILAFFAASRHARQVYAIDHAEIIEVAKAMAALQGLTTITFLKANSQEVTLREKVDVIVQEQMGSWIFNENMLESVLDLRNRLLKPGGKILPAKFELYVEPVQLKEEYRVPFVWEQQLHGLDFTPLRPLQEDAAPDHFYRDLKALEIESFLCQPTPLLTFDLETIERSDLPIPLHYHNTVVRPGRLDGFCLYFRAIFDEQISFTTSPLEADRTHHWANLFYRVAAEPHEAGDVIEFTLNMGDVRNRNTWAWDYPRTATSEQEKWEARPVAAQT
jgi:protein arginine N-methyltransferase 1